MLVPVQAGLTCVGGWGYEEAPHPVCPAATPSALRGAYVGRHRSRLSEMRIEG